jgi:hypothetical protein
MRQSGAVSEITRKFQTIEKARENTSPRHHTPATLIPISTIFHLLSLLCLSARICAID